MKTAENLEVQSTGDGHGVNKWNSTLKLINNRNK